MFSILRFIVIVGVIFYYSPVRQKSEGPDPIQAFFSPKAMEQTAPVARAVEQTTGHLGNMWQALPDNAKQAVVEKVLTTSGFTPAAPKATDTLQPEDRQAGAQKPRG
jgi:hypothetical protein